ncbi:MAG: tripartite tricarboxylate transporter substrate-binding protein [Microcella sp.]|uniref:tripartite tricarboxylate transporter substrate-binding protein n=1 Tax=Microcella sp. TaxID=1913979 RepID=UPI003314AB7B
MRNRFAKRMVAGGIAAASAVLLAACSAPSTAPVDESDPAAFYDGNTLELIVPYNPGGGFDTFVRLLAPHLEAEVEGLTVQVTNLPGAGGLIGANVISQAAPDGLTVGLINYPGSVFAEATEADGLNFSNADWTYLARLGAINPIMYTSEQSGLSDFESMVNATEPITFGIGGVGSDAYYATVIVSEVLGFPAEIIAGYPGGAEADAALLVGEVNAGVNSVDAALSRIEGTGTNINVLIGTEANPKIPDVPTITGFGDADQQRLLTSLASIYDLERIMVGPNGIDEERAAFLADAIFRAATSDGYLADMEEAGITVSALDRAGVLERATAVSASIDDLAPLIAPAE